MNLPSRKTLSQVFKNPKEARRILEMTKGELQDYPGIESLFNDHYHVPKTYQIRLEALNFLGGFFGVECIDSINQANGYSADEYAEYLNAGDTYALTIIYWRGRYRVQSIGDFIANNRVKFR